MNVRRFRTPVLLAAAFLMGLMLASQGGNASPKAPAGVTLSHFKCYPITEGGINPPHAVVLQDQFGQERSGVGLAKWLCTPVFKQIVKGPPPEPPVGPEDHLKCYVIRGQVQPPLVALHNQLGTEPQVKLAPARLLCVPTTKRVIPPG